MMNGVKGALFKCVLREALVGPQTGRALFLDMIGPPTETLVNPQKSNSDDRSMNLVLYGVTENDEEDLLSKLAEITTKHLQIQVPIEKMIVTRIGTQKGKFRTRPHPLRLKFKDDADLVQFWRTRFRFKGTQFSVSEDLSLRARIEK